MGGQHEQRHAVVAVLLAELRQTLATPIAEQLSSLPSIAYLAVCAGRYALFAEAVCENAEDLLRLLDEEVRPTPGVAAVEPAVFLRILYKRLRPLL